MTKHDENILLWKAVFILTVLVVVEAALLWAS